MPNPVFFPVAAFGTALLLTPLFRAAALRLDRFGRPDRNGRIPVPPIGGVAIFLATLLLAPLFPLAFSPGLLAGAAGAALVGFLDDLRPFSPFQKLGLQAAVAAVAVGLGVRLDLTGIAALDGLLTGAWLVWICNAFNVVDMMDGLAAGVGALAALGFAGLGLLCGAVPAAAVALAGALAGFLVYNFHPARVYMGDAGSLFTGFVLGTIAVEISHRLPPLRGLVCPLVVLGVPLFEAAFLVVVRTRKGLPVMRASRDHVAQRLVQTGCSVRGAVGRMYAAGLLLALLGVAGAAGPAVFCWTAAGASLGLALWVGVRLGRVEMPVQTEGP